MKSYNIDEIIDICNGQGYGFVCLTDGKGAELIPYNSRNTAMERLDEIKTRLSSPALKDGVYYVKCKHTNRKNALSDDYLVYKGEKLAENVVIQQSQPISAEVLTYDSALRFQVRIKELELENEKLKSDLVEANQLIDELQAEIETSYLSEESEDDEPTPQNTMFESAKEFLSEIVSVAAPLLDKHFDLKQQALNLEAHKILRGQRQAPPNMPPKQTEQTNEEQE
jgi:hypothetical protein